jgi:hypothetical protein
MCLQVNFFLVWMWCTIHGVGVLCIMNVMTMIVYYKKSWFFKMFNLTKMSTLTKRMFTLIEGMGHERHMVVLIGSFD